jgi:hypothetical protein
MILRRLLITGVCVIIVWGGILLNSASPQQVDFRVNNLESDVRSLQLRLQQIELIVNNSQASPNSRQNLSQSQQEKMFKNLATLVVELNQKVNKLTIRVNQLEKLNVK